MRSGGGGLHVDRAGPEPAPWAGQGSAAVDGLDPFLGGKSTTGRYCPT